MSRYSVEAILSVKGAERFRAAFDNASQAVERMEQASSRVRGVSQKIGSIGSDLTNKITKPALVATGALAGMVGALGFKRLVGMDNAQAKLKGLGVEGKQLEQVMQDVDSAVTGTTHTMAEGADVAAGALAAGVKEGADLERYIKLVGDAATGANVPMGEMAQIFNRVQGTGKMTRDELNQIEHRLPGFSQAMMKHVGADSLDAFHDMVTAGKVGTDDLLNTMDDFAGGMSEAMAGTWQGIASRVLSNIGILGEKVLDGLFEDGKKAMSNFVEVLRSEEVKKKAEEIGESLRNMVNRFVDVIVDLKQKYDELNPSIQEFLKKFALIGGIVALAIGPVMQFIGWIGTMVSFVMPAVTKVKGVFTLLGAAIGGISAPVWIVIAVLAVLVGVFVTLWNKSEAFREGMTQTFEMVKETVVNAVGHVVEFVQELFGFLVDWWQENNELILETANTVWQGINDKIEAVMTYLVPFLEGAWIGVQVIVSTVWEWIKTIIMVALEFITGFITATMHVINGDWGKAWETVRNTFTNIWERIKQFGENVTENIKNLIGEKFDQLKNAIRDKLEEGRQHFVDKFNNMKSEAINKGLQIVRAIKDKFDDAKNAIKDRLEDAKEQVKSKMGDMPGIVMEIGPKLYDAGKNIITSIIKGIESKFKALGSTMSTVAGNIRGYLPFSPAKYGPLKDIMNIKISESIAEAIERGKHVATKAMHNLATALDGEMVLNHDGLMGSIETNVLHSVESKPEKQPAYVVVRVGNSEFSRFVEDITDAQDYYTNRRNRFR